MNTTYIINTVKEIDNIDKNKTVLDIITFNRHQCLKQLKFFATVVNDEKRKSIIEMRRKFIAMEAEEVNKDKKKLQKKYEKKAEMAIKGIKRQEIRTFKKLTSPFMYHHIESMFISKIWNDKQIMMDIDKNECLPLSVVEHIMGYMSLTYVWYMFMKTLNKNQLHNLAKFLRKENILNIETSNYYPKNIKYLL